MFWKEDKRKKYKLAYKSSLTTFEPNLPREKGYNVKVEKSRGEFYCTTVKEAEDAGFRRAFRYRGNKGKI